MFFMSRNIERGIDLLDHINPDWHYRIHVDSIRMQYNCSCLLARLYGDYETGLVKTGLNNHWNAYKHGFCSLFQVYFNMADGLIVGNLVGMRLNRAWKKVIKCKRQHEKIAAHHQPEFINLPKHRNYV